MEQSGPIWIRNFIDPATGEQVEVRTEIPPLLTEVQILRLKERAKQNQMERAGWTKRRREYPLGRYLRCSNPNCNWSNLSGQVSIAENSTEHSKRPSAGKHYEYYVHLPRKRQAEGCFTSMPAEQIEDEIFCRLGQFLSDSDQLTAAIRAALISDPTEIQKLKEEQAELINATRNARRVMANALEVVFEQKGTAAAAIAQGKVDAQNRVIADTEARLIEVRNSLKVIDLPKDFPERFAQTMFRMVGMNGRIPMAWPIKAKKALLGLFFGGSKSTQFDRKGPHQHSDERGIFVTKIKRDGEAPFWRYEARGSIGDFAGALTRITALYDYESSETVKRQFTPEELTELASLASTFEGGGAA